jgi:shikimate kinase/3-dehydroquinate synthase
MAMRPLVLVGFMGAGKTTVGGLLADLLGTSFVDADDVVTATAGMDVPAIFAAEGEGGFRARARDAIASLLAAGPGVIALGGGALREPTIDRLREAATVVWLDVDADTAWARVQVDGDRRPLARDEDRFRALHAERRAIYAGAADNHVDATPAAAAVAAAVLGSPIVRPGALDRLDGLVGDRRAALIVDDEVVDRIPGAFAVRFAIEGGEAAKSVDGIARLWHALADADLERRDLVVAAGGGTVTDAAGFAAASFRRGIPWLAVPTTLVGQVDAAIGGKTGINVATKNDVGAFHLPRAVLCDPTLLDTLSPRQWAAGFAEAVKTGLLAGGRLHRLCAGWEPGPGTVEARTDLVRLCSSYKVRVVTEDPREQGIRAFLNLGHTIGHGVEAVAGYGGLLHGEAIAVGLAAALWLSVQVRGLDPAVLADTEALLVRHGLPIRATGLAADAVGAAMRGDKKRAGGRPRFVLLDAVGAPVHGIDPGDELIARAVERAVSSAP